MRVVASWRASALVATLVLGGCSAEPPGELVKSAKQRVTEPAVPAEDLAAVTAGNTELGVALYRQAARPGENLFLSPLSVTQGLAMVYAGARGATEQQMAGALRYALPQERLHPALNALDLTLTAHAEREKDGKRPELRLVNAAWGQRGLTFEAPFLDVLAESYGTGMRVVDFAKEPEHLRERINAWVEDQTAERIQGLLPEGSVTTDTRLALTNALYFKAPWAVEFDPRKTHAAPFTLLDGSTREVQMMGVRSVYRRMTGSGYQAVALPYAGDAFRMLLVLPDAGRFEEVEGRLSPALLGEVRAGLQPRDTALEVPRFEVEAELPLADALKALGMVDAFSEAADFSGITTQEALLISGAFHKAFVMVTESGTEAAAATGSVGEVVSLPEPFTVDRPFLFLIEDVETGAVLFLGRVLSP